MTKDDYKSSAGGALKLKGAKSAGVDKKRKKDKKLKTKPDAERAESGKDTNAADDARDSQERDITEEQLEKEIEMAKAERERPREQGKTEAERRHDEMRRRRLNERLQREGSKTHKERVEELNKYLSKLSEHHDMPRIGPG